MAAIKRLTLLRHAKAASDEPSLADRDRPLTRRGRHDAAMMGQRLHATGVRFSLILTSPAVRAFHTAKLVAREIGYPIEFLQREAELYLASVDEILSVVALQDDAFNDIIVCGHNPGVTELANRLSDAGIDNVPTCGVVVIEAGIGKWRQLKRGGRLIAFDYPKNSQVSGLAQITTQLASHAHKK